MFVYLPILIVYVYLAIAFLEFQWGRTIRKVLERGGNSQNGRSVLLLICGATIFISFPVSQGL